MRIFACVRHSLDPVFYHGGLWSRNFYPALQQLGCEIVESQVDLRPTSRFMHIAGNFTKQESIVRGEITQQIIDEVRKAHAQKPVTLFLSYFYNAHFDPAGFAEIHRLGIPTVNFYCNSIYQFDLVAQIAKNVNFAWHTERDAQVLYHQVGANPVWVQMGADPEVYYPVTDVKRQAKACFIGQRYADRDRLILTLLRRQVPLDLYGSGWGTTHDAKQQSSASQSEETTYLGRKIYSPGSYKSYAIAVLDNLKKQGTVTGIKRTIRQRQYMRESQTITPLLATANRGFADSICHTFAQYEVVLNFSNVWADGRPGSSLIPHVRLRDFEAPMCRTCYLTGYTDEITEFYEIGKEIDVYREPEELVDKTRFYLTHLDKAEQLRYAAYQRAIRDHTWQSRFKQLFRKIGIEKAHRYL